MLECNSSKEYLLSEYDVVFRLFAVCLILLCSIIGVFVPILSTKYYNSSTYLYVLALGKHFGTGVIISASLVHMLLPAIESLENPCAFALSKLVSDIYPYALCVTSILLMQLLEDRLIYCLQKQEHEFINLEQQHTYSTFEEEEREHGHSHGIILNSSEITIQAYMLEIGLTVHSVFIGLTLGFTSKENFEALMIALSFHQFFEGIGLGSRLADPELTVSSFNKIILCLIFGFSAPIGMLIGIITFETNMTALPSFLFLEGTLESMCSGVLLYVAFILLFLDFPKDAKLLCFGENSNLKKLGMFLSLWCGAAFMAFLGAWI